MPDHMPHCVVVIPMYNGGSLTATCLDALLRTPAQRSRWTIVVVDDGSTDGSQTALSGFLGDVRLVTHEANTGFAGACNSGAREVSDCDYYVFLNNDTVPTPGWLDALVEEAESDERVAAVGAKLLFPNGQVQHAGVAIGQDCWPHHLYAGFDGEHEAVNRPRDVAAVTAACMLVRRQEFDELGGFDTGFRNGYEDIDLCLRLAERGRLIRYCPSSVVYHLESATRWPSGIPEGTETSARLYEERWRSKVAPDDVQRYLDDGLLSLSYGAHYPLTMQIAPDLAVVETDDEQFSALERLALVRSRQVMDLLSARTRQQLRSRASVATQFPAGAGAATPVKRVADGREHTLGEKGGAHLISVVMPVKDAAADLRELIPLVLGQSGISARLEIVAIDSGSQDETVGLLIEHGATVLSIDPADFDHGLTRNLGAEHARGDVLVFLNKQTRPVDDGWLAPLIAALDLDPELAGVCSRVVPRADADLLSTKERDQELSGISERQRKQITDWDAYRGMSAEERRQFMNFHTVSTAIRAEALRVTPFRSVRTIGEDLLWAREVLESGWALLHEPASVAYHSHSYSLSDLLSRNVDDGIANRDIVDRSLGSEDLVPLIRALVTDDWQYLRDALGLTGTELERWQLEAALRRTAQVVGQWIGVNYETLPEGLAVHFSRVAQTRAVSA
jgi:GT2 family glycosyltransferase